MQHLDFVWRAGVVVEVAQVEGDDRLGGWKAAEIVLGRISRKDFPTAWICANGLMARGVINSLMQSGWRVPDVILSGDRDIAEKARTCGADDYLGKPFEFDDLLRLVDKYARAES